MLTRMAQTLLLLLVGATASSRADSAFTVRPVAAFSSSPPAARSTTTAVEPVLLRVVSSSSPFDTTTALRVSAGKDADLSESERAVALEKATRAMTAFSNKYIANTDTKYCTDLSIPAVVIKGLAEHKVSLGAPLCPCRYYEDKEMEARDGFWNCPCVPMRERHECHCMLFLTEDNDFAGEETEITYDEVVDLSGGAKM